MPFAPRILRFGARQPPAQACLETAARIADPVTNRTSEATRVSEWFREHVRRYHETGGEDGHIWREGATILLLTTIGRKTHNETTVPLIYRVDADNHIVVASNNGAPENPGWYLNLQENPEARIQVLADVSSVRARDADAGEYDRLWMLMNEVWPHYATYQAKTARKIPVVVLERVQLSSRRASTD